MAFKSSKIRTLLSEEEMSELKEILNYIKNNKDPTRISIKLGFPKLQIQKWLDKKQSPTKSQFTIIKEWYSSISIN